MGTVVHMGIGMEFLAVVLDVTMGAGLRVCGTSQTLIFIWNGLNWR